MYGEFWSYRGGFNGCIPGLGMPGAPYSGSYPDRFGNVRPNTSRKRGETVPEWIAREVRAAVLSVQPQVHTITDGQGFIIGHRRIPWYRGLLFTVEVARDYGERGKYRVWVKVYVVDLAKDPARSAERSYWHQERQADRWLRIDLASGAVTG